MKNFLRSDLGPAGYYLFSALMIIPTTFYLMFHGTGASALSFVGLRATLLAVSGTLIVWGLGWLSHKAGAKS